MGKKTRNKELRYEMAEQKLLAEFARHNQESKGTFDPRSRNRTWEDIEPLLDLPGGHEKYHIRPRESWRPKSFNLLRQVEEYIWHLFVAYPTPRSFFCIFLRHLLHYRWRRDSLNKYQESAYKELIRLAPVQNHQFIGMDSLFFEWFIVIGQGGSFQKTVKGVMTKKEAHVFLQSTEQRPLYQLVWMAKCKVAGLRRSLIEVLMSRIFNGLFIDAGGPGTDTDSVIRFFTKIQQEANDALCSDIADYLRHVIGSRGKFNNPTTFSLKGRTLASIITLTNEWHNDLNALKLSQELKKQELADSGVNSWTYETLEGTTWQIEQIRMYPDLVKEGKAMKHCVVSYGSACAYGRSFIFSMTADGTKRLTIELTKHGYQYHIAQCRGKFNRLPKDNELRILRRWAREHRISIPKFYL